MSDPMHKESKQLFRSYYEHTTAEHSGLEFVSESERYSECNSYVDGSTNPNYRDQIAEGSNATTVLNGYRERSSASAWQIGERWTPIDPYVPSPHWTEYRWSSGNHYLAPLDENYVRSIPVSEADDQALSEYVRKVRRKQTTWQSGVFIGEILQLIRMVRNPAMAFRLRAEHYLDDIRRLVPRLRRLSRRQQARVIADLYLEYSFGWAPLFNDIDDAAQALAESSYMQDKLWEQVKGVGTVTEVSIIRDQSPFSATGPYFTFDIRETRTSMVKYYGLCDIGSYNAVSNPRRIGLDASNFLPTLWELLPWSFLADYFTNIGDLISAATLAKSSLRWTSRTVRTEVRREATNWKPHYAESTKRQKVSPELTTPGKCLTVQSAVNRAPYSGDLVPTFRFSLPGQGRQWLNMAALLTASKDILRMFRY